MSGGEIVVAPAVMVIGPAVAAAALVVIGAAVAAALVIKAAQAGTAAGGRALEQFGAAMEEAADAQDDREMRSRLWGLAAGAVVQANTEVRLLSARAARVGARVPMPSPYDLNGRGLADVRAWVARVQEELAVARAAVERCETEREQRTLLAQLPAPATTTVTAAELLTRYQAVLDRRRAQRDGQRLPVAAPVPVAPRADQDRVQAHIDAILTRLSPDANATEREQAIRLAAVTSSQRNASMSSTFVEALAETVDNEINPRVARRMEAARLLVGLEEPLVTDVISKTATVPQCARSIERLRAVVAGNADLTAADRRDADSTLAWVQREVDRLRLLEALAETFTGLGYAVSTGMEVNHTTALSVARGSWNAEHSADVWVDEQGQVRWQMLQHQAGAGAEATRCTDLNESMRQAGEALAARGFEANVQVPAELRKSINVAGSTNRQRRPDDAAAPKYRTVDGSGR
ncbi:hypothetical protein [Dactylosporangium sp. NPDC005555]|uniref:hypothetical protein n=1 Tax=Dactylosporangium sp. NPDC005555 TaxID=3154889 RepID=UPI0033A1E7B8